MRAFFLPAALLLTLAASAQYYYKDIVGTAESAELIKTYMKNKVRRVLINSYDGQNVKLDNFVIEQEFYPAERTLRTITRFRDGNQTVLTTYIDGNGKVIRTVDSSNLVVSTTQYSYDASGRLVRVENASSDSARTLNRGEQHIWEWNGNHPSRMVRIRNNRDTSLIHFVLDEQGNVTEERETRKGVTAQPIYYYYNEQNQLTDIVRFNTRAGRLLPEYMFEYSDANQVIQKITVPINNPDYTIWRYQYNAQGLKVKEAIYDKHKVLSGKVEYVYSFDQ